MMRCVKAYKEFAIGGFYVLKYLWFTGIARQAAPRGLGQLLLISSVCAKF